MFVKQKKKTADGPRKSHKTAIERNIGNKKTDRAEQGHGNDQSDQCAFILRHNTQGYNR